MALCSVNNSHPPTLQNPGFVWHLLLNGMRRLGEDLDVRVLMKRMGESGVLAGWVSGGG